MAPGVQMVSAGPRLRAEEARKRANCQLRPLVSDRKLGGGLLRWKSSSEDTQRGKH